MPDQLLFTMEVTLNGTMAGVLCTLVALGFVLIHKASGIFNSAQGVMVLSDRVVVMAYGQKIGSGMTDDLRNNPAGVSYV